MKFFKTAPVRSHMQSSCSPVSRLPASLHAHVADMRSSCSSTSIPSVSLHAHVADMGSNCSPVSIPSVALRPHLADPARLSQYYEQVLPPAFHLLLKSSGYLIVENWESGECFFKAAAWWTREWDPIRARRHALQCKDLAVTTRSALEQPGTVENPVTNDQIQAVVTSYAHLACQGLLVLHACSEVAVWFRPSDVARRLCIPEAAQMLAEETPPHLMLYTQMPNQTIGHFTACVRKRELGHCDNMTESTPAAHPNFEVESHRTAATASPFADMAGAGRAVETLATPASTSAVTDCLPAFRDPARSRSPQRHNCSPRSSSSIASTCLDSPSSPASARPEEATLSCPHVLQPGRFAGHHIACTEAAVIARPSASLVTMPMPSRQPATFASRSPFAQPPEVESQIIVADTQPVARLSDSSGKDCSHQQEERRWVSEAASSSASLCVPVWLPPSQESQEGDTIPAASEALSVQLDSICGVRPASRAAFPAKTSATPEPLSVRLDRHFGLRPATVVASPADGRWQRVPLMRGGMNSSASDSSACRARLERLGIPADIASEAAAIGGSFEEAAAWSFDQLDAAALSSSPPRRRARRTSTSPVRRLERLGLPPPVAQLATQVYPEDLVRAADWGFARMDRTLSVSHDAPSIGPSHLLHSPAMPRRIPQEEHAAPPSPPPCGCADSLAGRLSAAPSPARPSCVPRRMLPEEDVTPPRPGPRSAHRQETNPQSALLAGQTSAPPAPARPSRAPGLVPAPHASPVPSRSNLSTPSVAPRTVSPTCRPELSEQVHVSFPPLRNTVVLSRTDSSAERHAHMDLACALPRQLEEDMRLNPDAEVRKWLHYLVTHSTAAVTAAQRLCLWRQVPLYSSYICQTSLKAVIADTVAGARARKRQQVTAAEACELSSDLAYCTFFPLAVAARYVAARGGKPESFVTDMFLACLASCLHRLLSLSLYPTSDPDFLIRARFWAVLTGDPTTGKSPTYSWLLAIFRKFLQQHQQHFPWLEEHGVSHIYTRGTHAGLNETMRDTGGVILCTSPEARTVLDPAFINRLIVDDKHYVDLSCLLETASGGSYEWVTASDLRRARAARQVARRREEAGEDSLLPAEANNLLTFDHTSVNLCFFQQLSVLESWWVPLESKHGLGFSARILFSFACRAMVDPQLGRGSSELVEDLLGLFWAQASSTYGHDHSEPERMFLGREEEEAVNTLYYELGELCSEPGWGGASLSAMGKLEYHIGMMSQLMHILEQGLCQQGLAGGISSNAVKCAFRFFDRRLLHGCSVVDYASSTNADAARKRNRAPQQSRHPAADTAGRVLRQCTSDPITMTEMSRRIACLRRDTEFTERKALLQTIVDLDLGRLDTSARGSPCLWRLPLTDLRRTLLDSLGVPLDRYCPAQEAPVPAMRGCGRSESLHAAAPSRSLVWPVAANKAPEVFSPPAQAPPWMFSGVPLLRLHMRPDSTTFEAIACFPTSQTPGQHIVWGEDKDIAPNRHIAQVVLPAGTYAVVKCAGEKSFRALHTAPAALGHAAGHAGLAAEGPVVFAGEVQLGASQDLLAWTNVTGTYHFPEAMAHQSDLPPSMFWAFRPRCLADAATHPCEGSIALPQDHSLIHVGSFLRDIKMKGCPSDRASKPGVAPGTAAAQESLQPCHREIAAGLASKTTQLPLLSQGSDGLVSAPYDADDLSAVASSQGTSPSQTSRPAANEVRERHSQSVPEKSRSPSRGRSPVEALVPAPSSPRDPRFGAAGVASPSQAIDLDSPPSQPPSPLQTSPVARQETTGASKVGFSWAKKVLVQKPLAGDCPSPVDRPADAEKAPAGGAADIDLDTNKQPREIINDELPDACGRKTLWQLVESSLRRKIQGIKARPACGASRYSSRQPRFLCLCAGVRKAAPTTKDTSSSKYSPACPVVWLGRLEKASNGTHSLIVEEHGNHAKPEQEPTAASASKPAAAAVGARVSRRNFAAGYETVMLRIRVAEKMSAPQIRCKAREHCRDAEAARQAGRMPFDITHRPGWTTQKKPNGSILIPLSCSSCKDATKCTWQGVASYLPDPGCFELLCTGQHDPDGQRKKGGTVTAAQRAVLDASASANAFGRLVALNHMKDESPPDKMQEKNRVKNRSRKACSAEKARLKKALKFEEDNRTAFTVDDIADAIRAAGVVWRADVALQEAVAGALTDDSVESDDLVVLSFQTFARASGKRGCCAVVTTKELLQVPARLGNPDYIKVAVDATFKDIFGDWKLMPLGVLSKHLALSTLDQGIRGKCWCTHCTPVLYCVTNSDGAVACEHLLHAFDHVPLAKLGCLSAAEAGKTCPRRDQSEDGGQAAASVSSCSHIRQFHADWAKGLDAARRKLCPNSIRQGDFRHLFKEVQEKLSGKIHVREARRKKQKLQLLLQCLQQTRSHCTTLAEFHLFWTFLFKQLEAEDELEIVNYLKCTYFFRLPVQAAHEQYGLLSPNHYSDGILCAAWWGAYCRVQPGSASGTQSLEACHLHGFRDALVDEEGKQLKHLPPAHFFSRMKEVLCAQGRQLRKANVSFPDYPSSRDPVSASCNQLNNVGRSNAVQLLAKQSYIRRVPLPDVHSEAFVVPRTLLQWKPRSTRDEEQDSEDEAGAWVELAESNLSLTEEEAKLVAAMAVEQDCGKLEQLWRQTGILQGDTFSVDTWCRYRSNFVVVLTGELPRKYWLTTRSGLYLCSCKYFAVSGRCEHEQCVHHILHTGDIDLTLVGQVVGRPPRDHPSKRGWSSAALYWSGQAADKEKQRQQEAKRRATGFLPAAPCSLQPGELNAQHSDRAAAPCERADAAHHADTSTTASQQPDIAPAHPLREGGDSQEGGGSCGSGSCRARGPNLHGTNFDLLHAVLAGRPLPANSNIYFNAQSNASQLH